jgi:hypothetical protein
MRGPDCFNKSARASHLSSTLPSRVSNTLPPACLIGAAVETVEAPRSSLRLGPAGLCCAIVQTFFCMVSVLTWPFFSCAGICGGIPHLAELVSTYLIILISAWPKLAGFIGRRMPLAGGLDQLAALFRLFAQWHEAFHAGIGWSPSLHRRGSRSACETATDDWSRAAGRERAGDAAIHRRKRRIVPAPGLTRNRRKCRIIPRASLTRNGWKCRIVSLNRLARHGWKGRIVSGHAAGKRRRKYALRFDFGDLKRKQTNAQPDNQIARDQRCPSDKIGYLEPF